MASSPNTLLVDGQDLRVDFPGLRIQGDMNLYAPGLQRGEDDLIPGRRGLLPVPGLPYAAYTFSVFVIFQATSRGAMVSNLRYASGILNGAANDGLVTLTRRLANSFDTGYDECSALGRFSQGLALQTFNPSLGHCEFQFLNLEGGWHRSSDNVFVIP